MPYSLNIALSKEVLEILNGSGQRIVIAKPQEGGTPKVAWQVLRPMGTSSVAWEEEYGIYASYEAITNGATLKQMSSTEGAAAKGKIYTLAHSGIFSPTGEEEDKESYFAENMFSEPNEHLTVGLYQNATVNGKAVTGNPVSAAWVGHAQEASMTPYTTVYVWLQAEVASRTVVTKVTGTRTKVVFGGGTTEISLEYDAATGAFITAAGLQLTAGASVESNLQLIY